MNFVTIYVLILQELAKLIQEQEHKVIIVTIFRPMDLSTCHMTNRIEHSSFHMKFMKLPKAGFIKLVSNDQECDMYVSLSMVFQYCGIVFFLNNCFNV